VLENLSPDVLPRLLRRTTLWAMAVGLIAFIASCYLAPVVGSFGIFIGVGLAIFNFRFLDRQAAKVELKGEQSTKAVRRQMGAKTLSRLGVITGIVILAIVIQAPLGIGIVVGLVLYQLTFVVNVMRVVAKSGGAE